MVITPPPHPLKRDGGGGNGLVIDRVMKVGEGTRKNGGGSPRRFSLLVGEKLFFEFEHFVIFSLYKSFISPPPPPPIFPLYFLLL